MTPRREGSPPGEPPVAGADQLDEGEESDEDAVAELPIEDVIDLHGFLPRDIPSVVEEYLLAAAEKGWREVRLIHGRGTGFQRQRVREVLARHPTVDAYADAPPARGGWGATLVRLKVP